MKKLLFIDCCIRKEESRTKILADYFLENVDHKEYEIELLSLMDLDLMYLNTKSLATRDRLIELGELNHPRFNYAHQFQEAFKIVIASPFYDLSIPALLKVYIENCTVDGITFKSTENGLIGLCKADHMLYLTTRGGIMEGSPLEMATSYLDGMCKFLGIDRFSYVYADGMDMPLEKEKLLNEAKKKIDLELKSL